MIEYSASLSCPRHFIILVLFFYQSTAPMELFEITLPIDHIIYFVAVNLLFEINNLGLSKNFECTTCTIF